MIPMHDLHVSLNELQITDVLAIISDFDVSFLSYIKKSKSLWNSL